MKIQVIDPLESRRQRLRSIFVVRALRGLERLAPRILQLVARFRDEPQPVTEFRVERPTLEDVFLQLTGRSLRD